MVASERCFLYDHALLSLSGGALGLSLTFLQFANLPVANLSLLEYSWA